MTPTIVKVRKVRKIEKPTTVCDITVADNHNLFVCDEIGNSPILAHNCLDENLRTLSTVLGEWYYSLANISVQYGFEGYLDAKFGKADRTNIANVSLTKDVLHYMGLDVVVPIAIFEQQKKHAQDIGYKKWIDVVRHDISDTLHAFTEMEHTGALVDIPHLFYLRTKGSPIEKVIEDMEQKLYTSKAAVKANAIICKQLAIPTTDMFNQPVTSSLRLSKPEHKQTLFFKVLKLKPLDVGKSGAGKVDKAFQTTYASVPEVAMFTAVEKAKKLKNAYVKSFITLLGESEDFQNDYRIRPTFHFLRVVTHRGASASPNLQNIPTHSPLAKHIKRMFVSRPGTLYVKVDYKAHEVRGWGIISSDSAIAELFMAATKLVNAYRLNPTSELAVRLKTEADIHIQNAAYFFKKSVAELVADKEKKDRSAVKGVVFGLIYQKSVRKLAEELGRELEWMQELVRKFFKRFPNGMKWLDNIKIFSKKNLYVEAPSGIRRNLWGYMLPESHEESNMIHSKMARQACNCIAGDSVIDTDNGLFAIRDLVGKTFNVRTKDGSYAHAPVCVAKGIKHTVKITTANGITQTSTPDHEFYVKDVDNKLVWKAAGKMSSTDSLCMPEANMQTEEPAFYYTKVVSVEDAGKQEVFDIAVPGPEHFISNGCVCHNSPIQGFCSRMMMSGIRLLSKSVYDSKKKWDDFVFHISNSVHDSLENEVGYKHFLYGLGLIENALTSDMARKFEKLHNFKINSVPEIEFEIGPHLAATETWDFSAASLERIVLKSLMIQRDVLGHKINVAHIHDQMFHPKAIEIAPEWLRQQLKNTGYKFELSEKQYICELVAEAKSVIAQGEAALKVDPEDKKALATVNSGKAQLEAAENYERKRKQANG